MKFEKSIYDKKGRFTFIFFKIIIFFFFNPFFFFFLFLDLMGRGRLGIEGHAAGARRLRQTRATGARGGASRSRDGCVHFAQKTWKFNMEKSANLSNDRCWLIVVNIDPNVKLGSSNPFFWTQLGFVR